MLLITIDHLIYWNSLLWLLIVAVWLGSLPFVKRSIHKQSVSSRLEHAAILRPLRDEPFWRNGRPARRWQVNPALYPARATKRKRLAESAETPSDAHFTDDSAALESAISD